MEVWDSCVGGYGLEVGCCDVRGYELRCVSNDTHSSNSIHSACFVSGPDHLRLQCNGPRGPASRIVAPSIRTQPSNRLEEV